MSNDREVGGIDYLVGNWIRFYSSQKKKKTLLRSYDNLEILFYIVIER